MPLYLDDFKPPAVPETHLRALLRIATLVSGQAVNPATAAALLREHVGPLLPPEHQPLFALEGRQPSWGRLQVLYAHLLGSSRGEDADLLAAAMVVAVVIRHTARPAREIEFPAHLEVASLERMACYLRLPVRRPMAMLDGREVALHAFCRYCWLPAQHHGVCLHHSTRRIEAGGMAPLCGGASIGQARRIGGAFHAQLTRLVSADEWQFHESQFTDAVLLPVSGLPQWLAHRRPALAQALAAEHPLEDGRLPSALMQLLYGGDGEAVLDALGGAMHLLTPVTSRAEAWLRAWQARTSWGGRRAGAGMRRSSA